MPNKKSMRKLIFKLLISGSLFAYLGTKLDFAKIGSQIQSMNPIYIPLIISLIILNYTISSVRWKMLVISGKKDELSLKYMTSLYTIGSFFNNFMPTSIGGDVYKIIKLGNKIDDKPSAAVATFAERFLGIISLILISFVGAVSLVN